MTSQECKGCSSLSRYYLMIEEPKLVTNSLSLFFFWVKKKFIAATKLKTKTQGTPYLSTNHLTAENFLSTHSERLSRMAHNLA